jgi:hypothetical protein
MSRRRSLHLTLLASVLVVAAACSGNAPAAPALTDPVDILVESVQTLQDVKTFHADLAVSGTLNVDLLGTGTASGLGLDNTTASMDVDVENKNVKATFAAPGLMGISGELIQIGSTSYVKTSLTGAQYQKSESETVSVDEATEMTDEDIQEMRDALAKPEVAPTKGDDVGCGDKQCYTVNIELTADEIESLGGEMPTGELPTDLTEASFNVTFKVEKDTLRPAGIDVEADLGSQGAVTLALTFSKWNEPVSIEAPPADQVQS